MRPSRSTTLTAATPASRTSGSSVARQSAISALRHHAAVSPARASSARAAVAAATRGSRAQRSASVRRSAMNTSSDLVLASSSAGRPCARRSRSERSTPTYIHAAPAATAAQSARTTRLCRLRLASTRVRRPGPGRAGSSVAPGRAKSGAATGRGPDWGMRACYACGAPRPSGSSRRPSPRPSPRCAGRGSDFGDGLWRPPIPRKGGGGVSTARASGCSHSPQRGGRSVYGKCQWLPPFPASGESECLRQVPVAAPIPRKGGGGVSTASACGCSLSPLAGRGLG